MTKHAVQGPDEHEKEKNADILFSNQGYST